MLRGDRYGHVTARGTDKPASWLNPSGRPAPVIREREREIHFLLSLKSILGTEYSTFCIHNKLCKSAIAN